MKTISETAKFLGGKIKENLPTILITLGVGGLFGAGGMAVAATPKALEKIRARVIWELTENAANTKYAVEVLSTIDDSSISIIPKYLTFWDKVEECWKIYLPSVLLAGVGTTMIAVGNKKHLNRAAVLAGLYSIAENTLQTYQAKVLEEVGKTKADAIFSEVNRERMLEKPLDVENILNPGGGTELCFETLTGRYFYSDVAKIRAAENQFNKELMVENQKSLNELFWLLKLPYVGVAEHIGWDIESGLIELRIDPLISMVGERPCLAIDYVRRPKPLWTE